jgi:hypothetical protein
VKGWPQNASHFNFEEFIPEEDASLVKILRDAGASKSSFSLSSSTSLSIQLATLPTARELLSLPGADNQSSCAKQPNLNPLCS